MASFSCHSVAANRAAKRPDRTGMSEAAVNGLLVRVGIDKTNTYGGWNAPVNTQTRRFMFIPIQDRSYNDGTYFEGGKRVYSEEVTTQLAKFAIECGAPDAAGFRLPSRLHHEPMHLDPDFLHLTYGDDSRRGRSLKDLREDDFIAFYASLQPLQGGKLVYALIGLFVLKCAPVSASQIPDVQRLWNAHTRWKSVRDGDIVVFGKDEESGLFEQCVPVGEFREGAYRVRKDVLDEWGGITV